MAHIFHNPHRIKLPQSQHEVEEFGRGKAGLVICKDCGSVYYKKSWHHGFEKIKLPIRQAQGKSAEEKDLSLKFILCPACQMIENKQYEGRIIIKNVSEKIADKLGDLILGFCRRAYERDPMDRLIGVKKFPSTGSGQANWEVTVTENQLVNKLANKIKTTFKHSKSQRTFASEPGDVAEITIEF